jgi:DNA-binding NtrC family response regulator
MCGRHLDGFSKEAAAAVHAYSWPGNLRELGNAVKRAVIMAKGSKITLEDLPAELRGTIVSGGNGCDPGLQIGSLVSMEQIEEAPLRKVLERTSNLAEAAQVLGIDQATL